MAMNNISISGGPSGFLKFFTGILFHKSEPMKYKAFWPVLVLQKGCWWTKFWCFHKNFFQIMGTLIIKVFGGSWICALIISFFNGWPINCFKLFLRYMWHLSNCGLEGMLLYCEVWIYFLVFLERLGYHPEQA